MQGIVKFASAREDGIVREIRTRQGEIENEKNFDDARFGRRDGAVHFCPGPREERARTDGHDPDQDDQDQEGQEAQQAAAQGRAGFDLHEPDEVVAAASRSWRAPARKDGPGGRNPMFFLTS